MNDIEAIKEALAEEAFEKEPLAKAIMLYLNALDPSAHSQIVDAFDKIISAAVDRKIEATLEDQDAPEVTP